MMLECGNLAMVQLTGILQLCSSKQDVNVLTLNYFWERHQNSRAIFFFCVDNKYANFRESLVCSETRKTNILLYICKNLLYMAELESQVFFNMIWKTVNKNSGQNVIAKFF